MIIIYTSIRTDRPKDPYTRRLVRVWKMKRTGPEFIGSMSSTGLDSWQMVATMLRDRKVVPAKLCANRITGLPRRVDLDKAGIYVHCLSDDTPQTLKHDSKGG